MTGERPRVVVAARWLNRRRLRVLYGVAALLAVLAAVDGAGQWRRQRWNERIAAGEFPAAAEADAAAGGDTEADARDRPPPQVRFAQAAAWAASGAEDAALNRWRALQDDPAVGPAARYNGANLLLRQALRLRELLRRDPSHWNARYNLERAQRLLADPDDADDEPAGPARNAERAATTMRGYSPGLP